MDIKDFKLVDPETNNGWSLNYKLLQEISDKQPVNEDEYSTGMEEIDTILKTIDFYSLASEEIRKKDDYIQGITEHRDKLQSLLQSREERIETLQLEINRLRIKYEHI